MPVLCKTLHIAAAATWLALPSVLAVPAPDPDPSPLHYPPALQRDQSTSPPNPLAAVVTPAPTVPDTPTAVLARGVGDHVESIISQAGEVGDHVASFFSDEIGDWFDNLPTGSAVLEKIGLTEGDLDAVPTHVLNFPTYANWTDEGWNVRVHGNVYKVPNITDGALDDLANIFLIDVDIEELPEHEQENARNLTASIFVVQQDDEEVVMDFVSKAEGQSGDTIPAAGGDQRMKLPYLTTSQGDFDVFMKLDNTTGHSGGYMLRGDETSSIQTLNMYTNGTDTGNATTYLVPPKGLTVVSDIDDILRITKIFQPKEGLLNSFARDYVPWSNMPEIFYNWSTVPDTHFHYLTTTPEQATRNYMEFIYRTYPLGSFDTRPLNFSDLSATMSIRHHLLTKVLDTFPTRKFILVADTTNSDVMTAYPTLALERPNQVACIFLRNTSATDDSNHFPYDTSAFKDLPQQKYMFFTVADDLRGLDVEGGNCWNESVRQNLTFSNQGLPLGLSDDEDESEEDGVGIVRAPGWMGSLGTVVSLLVLTAAVF